MKIAHARQALRQEETLVHTHIYIGKRRANVLELSSTLPCRWEQDEPCICHRPKPLHPSLQRKVTFSFPLLTFKSTEKSCFSCHNCAAMSFSSTEGMRQIPLNEHFLAGLASADLKPEEILESVHIPHSHKWEFVSAFRQAECWQNALPDVNAGMKVLFEEGTDTIADLNLAYGGVGAATVSAHQSCQQLRGR
ncbi:aldehyde oxidase 2-like [Loxodonta africana]|uniref:aldehyde oxidase 2-like n=1 Tax=Loxodonta africana TaxID=9785 RepID=UPI0030CF0A16